MIGPLYADDLQVYYRYECNDKTITNANDIPQSDRLYNVIWGKTVNIDCDYTVPNNRALKIVGQEAINITGNINTTPGCYYSSALIPPNTCPIQSPPPVIQNDVEKDEIIIFPNPIENDHITILSETKDDVLTYFEIRSMHGQLIPSKVLIVNGKTYQLGISNGVSPGIYTVSFRTASGKVIIKKVLKL